MRKLMLGTCVLALVAAAAVPAQAGNAVKSKTKVVDVFDEGNDGVGVYAKLKTSGPCLSPKRKFTLLHDGDKVDSQNGFSDALFVTDAVGIGDTVEVKTNSARTSDDGEQLKCKGSVSKPYTIESLTTGGS